MQWRCYWYYNIHRCNPGTRKTKIIIINKRHLYGAGKTARVGPSWWARGQPLEALIDQVNVNVPFSSIRPIYRGIPHAVWHMNYSFRIFQSCSVNTSFCTIYNKTRLQRVLESTCIHLYISVSIISCRIYTKVSIISVVLMYLWSTCIACRRQSTCNYTMYYIPTGTHHRGTSLVGRYSVLKGCPICFRYYN